MGLDGLGEMEIPDDIFNEHRQVGPGGMTEEQ